MIRKRVHRRRRHSGSPTNMELDFASRASIAFTESPASPDPSCAQKTAAIATTATVKIETQKETGVKPIASPKCKPPPPIYLMDKNM
ncbi:hypothetical protein EVAR_56917_1 [Eumeta japonica]|uniref:Uncharacterized protein n=1 Tax=Eumeta variegata TaxID=151549 RepID=A0A4C1YEG8_EUMVA|nr:hypothetical protein EVAR_56917_1 [Eumeta japonica]